MLILNVFKALFSVRAMAVITLIVILILLLIWSRNRIETLESKVTSYQSIVNNGKDARFYKDEKGRSHAVITPMVITENSVMKELIRSDSMISSLSKDVKGLRKNLSNLKHASFLNTKTTNIIHTIVKDSLVISQDTVRVLYQKFAYRTPWTEKSGEIVNGELTLYEKNYDSISVTTYWKRKWFLGKKHFFTESFSKNPDCQITILESVIRRAR